MKFLHYIFVTFSDLNLQKISTFPIKLLPPHNVRPNGFVQNDNKPICTNCKFFVPTNNICRKFATIDIVTGKRSYESAANMREDTDKCGEYAVFFEKNKFKLITDFYYFWLENNVIIISLTCWIIPYILMFILSMK